MCSSTANIEKNKATTNKQRKKNTYKYIQNITTENLIQQHN